MLLLALLIFFAKNNCSNLLCNQVILHLFLFFDRTRHIGNYCAIDVHFRMDGRTSLYDAHLATREIEDRLRQRFGPRTFINTHVEPLKHPTQTTAQQPPEAPNQA